MPFDNPLRFLAPPRPVTDAGRQIHRPQDNEERWAKNASERTPPRLRPRLLSISVCAHKSAVQERLEGAAAVGCLHGVVTPDMRAFHEHVRNSGLFGGRAKRGRGGRIQDKTSMRVAWVIAQSVPTNTSKRRTRCSTWEQAGAMRARTSARSSTGCVFGSGGWEEKQRRRTQQSRRCLMGKVSMKPSFGARNRQKNHKSYHLQLHVASVHIRLLQELCDKSTSGGPGRGSEACD